MTRATRARLKPVMLVGSLALLLASSASATLFDSGTSMIDTDTGLEWLDLTETIGDSWNQVEASSFVAVDGYVHATEAQVETLFRNAGFLTTDAAADPSNDTAANTLLNFLGCTQFCGTGNVLARGFADWNGAGTTTRPFYRAGGLGAAAATTSGLTSNLDLQDATAGHYLVRAVAPGTDLLPVGPFLDGALPPRTPNAPGTSNWDVVPAFSNLALPNTLVIVANPSVNRLYVGSQAGVIVSFLNDPNVTLAEPFLDLSDRVVPVTQGGFLGMAFHPQFGISGSPFSKHVYVFYSSHCPLNAAGDSVDLGACVPNYPLNGGIFSGGYLRLSRFNAPDSLHAQPQSEEILLNIRLESFTHLGGALVFGDDGYLYLTIGEQFRRHRSQDIVSNLGGGVLRLAVDVSKTGQTWSCPAGSHPAPRTLSGDEVSGQLYCIPDDNPWLDSAGGAFEEYFAIGLRNPHRMSKDPLTGRLWLGDVGALSREEIDVVEIGRNYGWPFREGMIAGLDSPPPTILGSLTDPVVDFTRDEAKALIGGYVYRGTQFPELDGRYLAGDYVTRNLWAITLDETTMTASKELMTDFGPGALGTWGQDNAGEIFLASVASTGSLYTLARIGSPVADPPSLLSQLGAFADLATLDPANGFIPYWLNQPFWSDAAAKQRWIALPNDGTPDTPGEQITWSESSDWSFPVGTVLMKHFELPVDETDPSVTTRLETRFLAHGDDGSWYGLTYRWLPDQSDARLLTEAETGDYTIQTAGGGSRTQTWQFPSRAQCSLCHNAGVAGALGPRTHQIHRDVMYPSTGRIDDQIRTWNNLGMFSPAIVEAAIPGLPRSRELGDVAASLADRARSYLDANCSYCHRPESPTFAVFDARLTTPLLNQGLVYGAVANNLQLPGAAVITPGNPLTSVLYHRMAALGAAAMPPLAKNLVDQTAVDLMAEWITRIDPSFPASGVLYEYYEIAAPTALPDFDSLTPVTVGSASGFDISLRNRDSEFAFRFSGVIQIDEQGDHTFYTTSNEGSQLFIDGALVVDNDGVHGDQEGSGTVALAPGFHDIVVTYFERFGGQSLTVSWEGPGFSKQVMSPGRLYQAVPPALTNQSPTLVDPGTQLSQVGGSVSLPLTATDPDGDALYFGAAGLPSGLTLDPNSGVISGAAGSASVGTHQVVVGVSDGPTVDSVVLLWTVEDIAGCGLGFELVLLLPVLAARARRRFPRHPAGHS